MGDPTVGILRSKKETVLRGEAYAWAPILGSFDKLREVGVLSCLVLHFFKYFMMFRLV